ncbi:hypothetical protein HNY73_004821 [Argiope bruennichi]|uniref:DUF5641 domain-containing protein n=1 Tax=Argiope bruennichi TaxID=94029 RepID=A0A8T0FSZ3_ARGBR|nr:hypothetical protein HNY73_004821 [Argiope bruennichi]
MLRERFRKEYLGQLVQLHRQHPQSSSMQIGDIVLIDDDVKKHLRWPLARVIELIPEKMDIRGHKADSIFHLLLPWIDCWKGASVPVEADEFESHFSVRKHCIHFGGRRLRVMASSFRRELLLLIAEEGDNIRDTRKW